MEVFDFDGRFFYEQKSNRVETTFFVGDSTIEQYYARVQQLILETPDKINSVVFLTGGGCLPIPRSEYLSSHNHCMGLMEKALDYARVNLQIKTFVIGAEWNAYLGGGWALSGRYGRDSADYLLALKRLSQYLSDLRELGKKVFLILNIPTGREMDPKYLVNRNLKNFPNFIEIRDGGLGRADLDKRYGRIQSDLALVAKSNGATVISPMEYLCSASFCPSVDEIGEPMYKDDSHLRPSYVRGRAIFIDQTLR